MLVWRYLIQFEILCYNLLLFCGYLGGRIFVIWRFLPIIAFNGVGRIFRISWPWSFLCHSLSVLSSFSVLKQFFLNGWSNWWEVRGKEGHNLLFSSVFLVCLIFPSYILLSLPCHVCRDTSCSLMPYPRSSAHHDELLLVLLFQVPSLWPLLWTTNS